MQLKTKIISLGLTFAFAAGGSFMLSRPVAASVDGDSCRNWCGPAPCCKIVVWHWCGCPWAEEVAE